MNAWVAVLAAGIGSYLFRFGMVAVIDRRTLPAWFERVSAYIMPAAFAGLAAAALHEAVGRRVTTSVPVLLAAVATAGVASRRPAHLAVAVGMSTLWASRLVLHLV
jgi:branched-subunit amino acid transport protein